MSLQKSATQEHPISSIFSAAFSSPVDYKQQVIDLGDRPLHKGIKLAGP